MTAKRQPAFHGPHGPPGAHVAAFHDFSITLRRVDAHNVAVKVHDSPAGALRKPVKVAFSASEASEMRAGFLASFAVERPQTGGMMLTVGAAAAIGQRLAQVLFPPAVFRLFAASLSHVVGALSGGLRVRLATDPALLDLPWEYVTRPDRQQQAGISAFLLLDPSISLVRQAANPRISMQPITGRQRLAFVGTFWEGNSDAWEVGREFALLTAALSPVKSFIRPDFAVASAKDGIAPAALKNAAIFHYAGHTDFDDDGRAFVVKEMPTSRPFSTDDVLYLDKLAPRLAAAGVRLAVMSACNSGYSAAAQPLIDAGVPAVIGINGGVASISAIEFCAKLYESLAVSLSLDEAVGRARLHVMEWGAQQGLFDWGLFMVHLACSDAVLFPRQSTPAVSRRQRSVRESHAHTIGSTRDLARRIDGLNFGEIMSELTKRRVLILGRFNGRRLPVLEAIKAHLQEHPNEYLPELFTFAKPESRDLVEAIIGFAALSRFVIADLSEPRSVQSELEAIAPHFQSVPIVPVINKSGREFATFESIKRRINVVKPTIRYRDIEDLLDKLDTEVVPRAEAKLAEVRPPAPV